MAGNRPQDWRGSWNSSQGLPRQQQFNSGLTRATRAVARAAPLKRWSEASD